MKTAKIAILALAVMACVGCARVEGTKTMSSSNNKVQVNLVTEFDGVRLYMVNACDNCSVIWVAVSSSQTSVQWLEPQGKTTVRREALTVQR